MKKILSIAILCCGIMLLMPLGNAQKEKKVGEGSAFCFGIKAGINFSNYINKSNMEPGGDAGLFLRAGRRFYFESGVYYSFRSTNFKDFKEEIQESFEIGQHFIDVPLLLGYKIVSRPNFNFRIFIGPRVGLRIGSNYDNIDDMIGYAQWGGQAGLGIDFWRFTFDVKYDISASKFKEYDEDTFWKQNMFNMALGFKFKK